MRSRSLLGASLIFVAGALPVAAQGGQGIWAGDCKNVQGETAKGTVVVQSETSVEFYGQPVDELNFQYPAIQFYTQAGGTQTRRRFMGTFSGHFGRVLAGALHDLPSGKYADCRFERQ